MIPIGANTRVKDPDPGTPNAIKWTGGGSLQATNTNPTHNINEFGGRGTQPNPHTSIGTTTRGTVTPTTVQTLYVFNPAPPNALSTWGLDGGDISEEDP